MTIHVRLRPGQDNDIAAWYEAQSDKSRAIREAIRVYIKAQSGEGLETTVQQVVTQELARLPAVVSAAVREALESYQFVPAGVDGHPLPDEDPELAARLDDQLGSFFD